jgi:SH3-like domain-containing protein
MTNRWLVLIVALAPILAVAAPGRLTVQIEQAQVKASPGFLSPKVAVLAYGDQVAVLRTDRGWAEVRDGQGTTGWVHESALTEKRVTLRAGDDPARTTADTREIALAGKGFSEQVEQEYKATNQELDFTWLDRMETFGVSDEAKVTFLREGGLGQ